MLSNISKFTLTDQETVYLPSEKEILSYEEKGWYASPIVLPEVLIDEAIEGASQFYAGKRDYVLPNSDRIANDVEQEGAVILNNEFVTLQKKELQTLGFNPLIAAIAAKLTRTSEIRLFADSLICKLPSKNTQQGVVGWHTDRAYWPTCTSDKMLTAWIPLQDCTVEMGTLLHIQGSNLWKDDLTLKSFYSFNNQDLGKFENYLTKEKPNHIKQPMLLKKGQISFHNCHTIHSSSPNNSFINRMALALHFQDGDNQYQKSYKPNGELIEIGYDKMCRRDINGNPDYSDPNLFPTLWKG